MYPELKLRLWLQKASGVTWMQKTWKFLLMWPCRKLKLSFSQVGHSVLLSAACPDFIWVSLLYLVCWVSNHFFTVLTAKFLVAASCSQSLSFFCLSLKLSLLLSNSSLCCLTYSTMASSSESLRKMDFIWPFFCLDWVDSTSVSMSVPTLLHPLSVPLFLLSLSSLSSFSLLSISSAVSPNSHCSCMSVLQSFSFSHVKNQVLHVWVSLGHMTPKSNFLKDWIIFWKRNGV